MLLSEDENTLFSGATDETIKIWDLNTRTCTGTMKTDGIAIETMIFYQKDVLVVCGGGNFLL